MALVDHNQDVSEGSGLCKLVKGAHNLIEAAVVGHARAHAEGQALLRLLHPRGVVHPRDHKDAVGGEAELRAGTEAVGKDKAQEGVHHARLARLHLRRQVHPRTLRPSHKHVEKALQGGGQLRGVGCSARLSLRGCPAELGLPQARLEAGGGQLQLGVGNQGFGGGHLQVCL